MYGKKSQAPYCGVCGRENYDVNLMNNPGIHGYLRAMASLQQGRAYGTPCYVEKAQQGRYGQQRAAYGIDSLMDKHRATARYGSESGYKGGQKGYGRSSAYDLLMGKDFSGLRN